MNIESELKDALRRIDPPPGFAQRVLERMDIERRPRFRAAHAVAAAALIAISLGGWGLHIALRARNEVLIAMRIASQKVAHVQQEVNRR